MSPQTAATACMVAAALVFLWTAEQLISGAWDRRREARKKGEE
jgi:hypothetical protein